MSAVEILAEFGVTQAEQVNEYRDKEGDKVVIRILTPDGWTYQKFDKHNIRRAVEAWVAGPAV